MQFNTVQCRRMQLNTAQCSLKNHWIRSCFGQCAFYDESPKLSTAQCSSMRFNTVQCRRMQLNTAQYSSMQFQFFGNIKHLKSSAQINAHSNFPWFPSNKWSQQRIWAYKYNDFGGHIFTIPVWHCIIHLIYSYAQRPYDMHKNMHKHNPAKSSRYYRCILALF